MDTKISDYFTKATKFFKKLDRKQKFTGFLIVASCLAAAVAIVVLLNYTNYVVLYSGLDTTECAEIASRLDEMEIKYKVEGENTIYVDKDEEPSVKLKLASDGYPKSALNYDIFSGNIDFMTTDFEKKQYSIYQLQERLQASIKTLDSINNAIVTINIPDNSLTVLDKDEVDASASVVLAIKSGVSLSSKQINGIEQLVAKSVPGLTAENIAITDQTGVVLNNKSDDLNAGKPAAENEISSIYKSRINDILTSIYGKDNINVGVNVVINYDAKVTETTTYTPSDDNAGVIDHYEHDRTGSSSEDLANGVPGTDSNAEIPGYETGSDSTTGSTGSDRVSVDYLVNKVIEQIKSDGAKIDDVTVSVLVNKETMSDEEVKNVTKIIANTAGISENKVALYNTEFAKAEISDIVVPNEEKSIIDMILSIKHLPIYAGVSIIIIALLIILTVISRKNNQRKLLKRILEEQKLQTEKAKDLTADGKNNSDKDIKEITETREQQLVNEIKDFSLKAPQITANLIRTLLKGECD